MDAVYGVSTSLKAAATLCVASGFAKPPALLVVLLACEVRVRGAGVCAHRHYNLKNGALLSRDKKLCCGKKFFTALVVTAFGHFFSMAVSLQDETFRVVGNGGFIVLHVFEKDGSVGEVDLLPVAPVLLARGSLSPRTAEENACANTTLGEIECCEKVQFFCGDSLLENQEAMVMLSDGLYRTLKEYLAHVADT